MAVNFTPQQQKVIDLHDRNILVSAAAGSGKTAVLVERIIKMITEETGRVDIDRLLVVTFTKAAAAEMRERISQAIDRRLSGEPENRHLQRQAALLHNAQITTIDSFCLFVIRNNFNDIGLDPGFRIADEGELTLMKQEVLEELLEQKYGEKDENFRACVEYFTGGSNDRALEEYVDRLYEFSQSYPWPEEWLSDRMGDYAVSDAAAMEECGWCRYLEEYIRKTLKGCAGLLDQALKTTQRPDGPYFYGELLEKEREMAEDAARAETFAALSERCGKISFGRLPGKKDGSVSADARERAKRLRGEAKKKIEEIRESFFSVSPEQAVRRMETALLPVNTLMSLVLQFKRVLDEKKRRENVIDFHDMEHFALNILVQRQEDGTCRATAAAREYRQFFHEILIDEYQDSNLVQELLLQSISGEEEGNYNRFMVGDVKQSIYKFRLARPELFIEKYNSYSRQDSPKQRIDLRQNFRSRQEVIESVNALFYRIMGGELGGVEYDEDAALYPGAVYPQYGQNQTETLLIERDKESRLSARQQEAAVIAARIRELIRAFQVTDRETGALRPAKYGDIVILLRTNSGWAEDFKQVFEKEGIPASVFSRTGYFQAPEVREVLQLLHVLDNPLQDIPFYGTMRSFFGGFEEEEAALIRSRGRGEFLYETCRALEETEQEEKEGRRKLSGFLAFLEEYRIKARYTPIHKLIQDILTRTGYLEYVCAKPSGEQRCANVEMLLTKAAAFENTSYYGLFHFLRYIEQLEKYQVDYGEADVLDENADVVRIMSIHKSKGLEFPICFVAGLSKKFNMQDTTGRLVADVDLGVGVDFIDRERRIQSKTLRGQAVSVKLRLDVLGEELRILYVAMTRAREKLFLSAVVPDCEKLQVSMEQEKENEREPGLSEGVPGKIPFVVLAGAGSFLDFILPCLREAQWIYPQDIQLADLKDAFRSQEAKQNLLLSDPDNEIMTYLSEKFDRKYPYEYLKELFVKTTVSELKKAGGPRLSDQSTEIPGDGDGRSVMTDQAFTKQLFEEPEVVPYIPAFMRQQEGMSGSGRGSAYHRVMELLDLKKLLNLQGKTLKEELAAQMDGMERSEKLDPEWRQSVSVHKLALFFQSSLARRMIEAALEGRLKREQPFVLGLPANSLNSEFPETETVLIQGIIDVFFEEGDRFVVVDYKTDHVEQDGELVSRYKVQLDYYARALARLTGKPVKEKIIYSFCLSQEILL